MYSNSTVHRSNSLFQVLHSIPEAIAVSNTQINASLQEIKSQLVTLTDAFSDDTTETPEDILLENADEGCIEQAFAFMRTLNEIESTITDSKFNEKKKPTNNEILKGLKGGSLYSNCIAILDQKLQEGQLSEADKDSLKTEFDALFEPVDETWSSRADRLADVHAFRDTILRFFAEICVTPEPVPVPSVVAKKSE